MNIITNKKSMQGLSLIELMVAMVIGLLLTAAVLQSFLSMKKTYVYQEEYARIQQNGRFAMEFLGRDIRNAGFWGCLKQGLGDDTTIVNRLNTLGDVEYEFDADIVGENGDGAGAPANPLLYVPDTLTLRGAVASGSNPLDVVPLTEADDVELSTSGNFEEGDIVFLGDCNQGDIFQITDITTAGGKDALEHSNAGFDPGNASGDVNKAYGEETQVYLARSVTYTIEPSEADDDVNSLYRNGEELVEGVENFQVLFGQDDDIDDANPGDGVPDFYVPAESIGLDMDKVVSVYVTLLVTSMRDDMVDLNQQVNYAGGVVNAPDRRIYRVFSSEFALRNRLK